MKKTSKRVLDRRFQWDERNRDFAIRRTIVEKVPRSYTWRCDSWLDQGNEGACVGFSWTHELNARPQVNQLDASFARERVYREAKKIDEWPGEEYEGTSVLAGAKVCQSLGYFNEYRWAFSLDDLMVAVGYAGPAVLGINWYDGMFQVNADGFVRVTGGVAGGHAILCNGISVTRKAFKVHNSWGKEWGINGEAWISFDDMRRLLHEGGEACIVMGRKKV